MSCDANAGTVKRVFFIFSPAWRARAAARGDSFVVLNLGSGSRRFREVSKPYIDTDIFDPLRRRGARVVHADLRQEDGVDVSGDLFDPGIQARLRALQPEVVLACNSGAAQAAPVDRKLDTGESAIEGLLGLEPWINIA
jgi:methyl coenzyme M reductase gamma subunit